MKLIPESYYTNRTRQKRVTYVLLLPFFKKKIVIYAGGWVFFFFSFSLLHEMWFYSSGVPVYIAAVL